MTDSEIDRALREKRSAAMSERRADLLARGLCLNGATHGPATHGRCCAWCRAVHNLGLPAVIELDAIGEAPPRPPGYVLRSRVADRLVNQ